MATHPLGHNVSLTNSTGTTNFGDGDTEKYLMTAAACAAMVRPRTLRWASGTRTMMQLCISARG